MQTDIPADGAGDVSVEIWQTLSDKGVQVLYFRETY